MVRAEVMQKVVEEGVAVAVPPHHQLDHQRQVDPDQGHLG